MHSLSYNLTKSHHILISAAYEVRIGSLQSVEAGVESQHPPDPAGKLLYLRERLQDWVYQRSHLEHRVLRIN